MLSKSVRTISGPYLAVIGFTVSFNAVAVMARSEACRRLPEGLDVVICLSAMAAATGRADGDLAAIAGELHIAILSPPSAPKPTLWHRCNSQSYPLERTEVSASDSVLAFMCFTLASFWRSK